LNKYRIYMAVHGLDYDSFFLEHERLQHKLDLIRDHIEVVEGRHLTSILTNAMN